jgi:uncharacterized protein (DUF427 family)
VRFTFAGKTFADTMRALTLKEASYPNRADKAE